MPEPTIQPTAGGDWVVGAGASYVPCPTGCGRMAADMINGVIVDVEPCMRCRRLAAMGDKKELDAGKSSA